MKMHADPWDEACRLERLLEADLLTDSEGATLRMSAETFCKESCRVGGNCRFAESIRFRVDCPLWMYIRETALSA